MKIIHLVFLMFMNTIVAMHTADRRLLAEGFLNATCNYVHARQARIEPEIHYRNMLDINTQDIFSTDPQVHEKRELEKALYEMRVHENILFDILYQYAQFPNIEIILDNMSAIVNVVKQHVRVRSRKSISARASRREENTFCQLVQCISRINE
ncbi:MAG TPA: hypothetical protein PLU71_00860 [Candidatus Dependentiae bacterium]|nr:hypothetical protein [Candidatus Dependentiae bacterium]HRQ62384.1 hypothetical protein [Candidatus Dependentiae bacterium]